MERVRVLVADDHTIVRRGIVDILAGREEMEVVGEARDGLEAIEKTKELEPDVVVMDLMMPNCNGLESTQTLHSEMPELGILVLTVSDKEADLFDAIRFGARGYLLKNVEPEELIRAILHTAGGGVIVSPCMAATLLGEFKAERKARPQDAELSSREGEVLELVARGASNKEIASALSISENTVKTHLRSIMDKLHLANRSQAAAYAARSGLVHSYAD